MRDLQRAYRHRARETHPDLGGSAEEFRRVSEAYEVLSNGAVDARQTVVDAAISPAKTLPLAHENSGIQGTQKLEFVRKRRWYLLVPTLYAYLLAPHMGWARLPSALRTTNDALRSSEWGLMLAYLLMKRRRN